MSTIEEEIQRLQTAKANIKSALTSRGLTIESGETMSDFSADVSALPSVGGTTVTGISLNKATTSINVGSTETLTATITPDNATNKTVAWTSSDTNVATVANGVVTAISEGSATITATSQEGRFTATCAVTAYVPVTGVYLNPSSTTINVGSTSQLEGGVIPVNATDQQVTYTSSDETVATVSSTGLVTAISAGSATITITSHEGGFTATSAITCQAAANYGTLTYYSSFERAAEVEEAEECTVNDIDQETFLAWYDKQEPSMMGEDRFTYESGTWMYNWETEIEDMATIGIDVTLDEGIDFAEIQISAGWTVDKTSESLEATITSESDYNLLGRNDREAFITLGGVKIPFKAFKSFAFGTLATTTPQCFLRFSGIESIDFTNATNLTSLGQECFSFCDYINSSIAIPNSVTSIGSGFLYYSQNFNQAVTLPSNITSIGDFFMQDCTSFNQPLSIPNSITTIPGGFLDTCSSFNQSLTIPNSITSIGQYFLNDCSSFNQPLTIPENVNSVGIAFMYSCTNYTSTITVETAAHPTDQSSLSTYDASALMYTTGVTLAGTYAQTWKNALPDRSSSSYRKLIVAS